LALASRDRCSPPGSNNQRAVRAALRASFKQISVPEGLKEQIVSERRARMTLAFKRKALLASAAATVLLMATAVVILNRPPGEDKHFSGFQSRMAGIVLRSYPQQMDLATNDLGQIHQYLVKQGQPDYILPAALAKTCRNGLQIADLARQAVSMVLLELRQKWQAQAARSFPLHHQPNCGARSFLRHTSRNGSSQQTLPAQLEAKWQPLSPRRSRTASETAPGLCSRGRQEAVNGGEIVCH